MRTRVLALVLATAAVATAIWPATIAASKPKPGVVKITVARSNGAVLAVVPVVLHGHRYLFAVDTGATATAIDNSVTAKLGLPKAGKPVHIFAAGCQSTAQRVRVSHWHIGGVQLPSVRAVSSALGLPKGLDGLLGSDVLAQFGHVTLDYGRQLLELGG